MAKKFSFSKRYNKEKLFNVDTSNYEYRTLEEIYIDEETVYPVCGVYINNKSLYEPAPVIATDECYVNIPSHMLENCREMLKDEEAINAINEGFVGFTIYKYHQEKYNKDCYSVRWVDITPEID